MIDADEPAQAHDIALAEQSPPPAAGVSFYAPGDYPPHDPVTGEVFDEDAPAGSGWDSERHCATDLRGADWAGRKLREASEMMEINHQCFDAEIATLRRKEQEALNRLAAAQAPHIRSVAYFDNALRVFAETHREEVLKGLRTKSRLLPSGVRIGWRKEAGGYRWDQSKTPAENKAALLAWARSAQASVPTGEPMLTKERTLEEADLDAVKTFLQAHADPEQPRFTPPGLEYVPPGETLSVSVETKEGET